MKKVFKSFYGKHSIFKGFCKECGCYSFIIDKKLQCCDAPVDFDKKVIIKSIKEINLREKRRPLSEVTKLKILENQKYKCFYCDTPIEEGSVHYDHVVPFILTLSCDKDEFVATCVECNLLKGSKIFNNIVEIKEYLISKKESRNGR